MKTLKIILALSVVIGLIAVTVGLSFATFTGAPFDYMHGYVQNGINEDWWDEMLEHMEARWTGIEDEAWFDDMTQYMEEHYNEVQNQPWYDEMIEYMEENGYHSYAGPRSSGRGGFGCWGW